MKWEAILKLKSPKERTKYEEIRQNVPEPKFHFSKNVTKSFSCVFVDFVEKMIHEGHEGTRKGN
jgi:hypothetical protein